MAHVSSPTRRLAPRLVASLVGALAVACELVAPIPDLTSGAGALDASSSDAGDGGAPRDASDASAADAGDDAGDAGDAAVVTPLPTACATPHLYCNGFDKPSDLTDFAPANVTATLDTSMFQAGTGSARVDIVDAANNGIFAYNGAAAIPPDHVFVRVLVKQGSTNAGGGFLFIGRSNFSDGVQVYVGNEHAWHLQRYNGADTYTGVVPDLSTWHCVELELDFTNLKANGYFDANGPFALSLTGAMLPYTSAALVLSVPTATRTWFDDFVLDTKRVGCP